VGGGKGSILFPIESDEVVDVCSSTNGCVSWATSSPEKVHKYAGFKSSQGEKTKTGGNLETKNGIDGENW